MRFEPIAVVGLGCLLPDAQDILQFLANLREAKYSISEVDPARWDPNDYYHPEFQEGKTYSKIGGWTRDFTFEWQRYRIPPTVLPHIDMVQQWAITVCDQALCDAGYREPRNGFDPERCAVIMGNSMGGEYKRHSDLRADRARYERIAREVGIPAPVAHNFAQRLAEGIAPITEDTMPGELPNVIAGRVAQALDLQGPNYVTDAACASSLAAVIDGCMLLQTGHADWVVAGAADRMMDAATYAKFCAIGALSAEGSFPFDARASGFVMGEGAGAVVLRRLQDAMAHEERIYAVIRGMAGSSDGRGKGITAPNPRGQETALRQAYAMAEYSPDSIDMVEAHGTATQVGDATEVNVLKTFFENQTKTVALGSVKSMLGHLKAAAGIASLVKVSLALHHGELLPTANFSTPNPAIPWASTPFRVLTSAEPWPAVAERPPRAGLSAFGFGGTNFHATLEQFDPGFHAMLLERESGAHSRVRSAANGTHENAAPVRTATQVSMPDGWSHDTLKAIEGGVLCFTGQSIDETIAQARLAAERWLTTGLLFDDDPTGRRLSQVAWEQFQQVGSGSVRLALAVTSWQQLRERLPLLDQVADPRMAEFLAAQGVFLQDGPHPTTGGEVAFIFPGQGSQYLGMLHDLGQRYRVIGETWDTADETLASVLDDKLSGTVFPHPFPVSSELLEEAERRLRATEHCQPAMVTSGAALLELYRLHGLQPTMVGGHSLGEYTALVAAGALSFPDALRAVAMRGTEMAALQPEDPGIMATVSASESEVQKILADCPGYVIAANKNSPRMTVIAGETPAVEAALERCRERGIQTSPVAVSHAFHSRIVALADEPLLRFLRTLTFHPPTLPVSSNVDGGFYPEIGDGEAQDKILARLGPQMSHAVEWTKQIQTMHEAGARVWVECGPKRSLSIFNQDVLVDAPHLTVTTNHPKQGGIATWLAALARLWTGGQPITIPPLESDIYTRAFQAGPPIQISSPSSKMPASSPADSAAEMVSQAVAVLSAYPRRLLTPALTLTQDLGLDAAGIATLLEYLGDVSPADDLQTLADVIEWYRARGAPAVADRRLTPVPLAPTPAEPRVDIVTPVTNTATPVATAPATTGAAGTGAVETYIIGVLSEKTGYPPEVLGVDLDLEGELGIDTVKQAEVLGIVFEHYGVPLPEGSGLRELNTIEKLVHMLVSQLGNQSEPPSEALQSQDDVTASEAESPRQHEVERFWRVAPEPLETSAEPLAVQEGLVILTDDGQGLAEAMAAKLRQRGFTPAIVTTDSPMPTESVVGFIYLTPASMPPLLSPDLAVVGSQAALASRQAFMGLQVLQPHGFAVSVTRVDGGHGFRSQGRNPLPLGAHGVFASFAYERPELRVRCYDLQPSLPPDTAAARVLQDLLEYGGPVEIGLSETGRSRSVYHPVEPEPQAGQLRADDVFLVSGGAGGITAACLVALARELKGGRFALLGRTPLDADAERLAQLSEEGLEARKQALGEEMRQAGQRVTPVALEQAWQPLARSREAYQTLTTLQALGATARYLVCDVQDADAVSRAVQACREQLGAPTVILHGAGVERSRQLADKSVEEFDLVHNTKVAGWWNLQAATADEPVRLFATFTSVVGHFGNAGQADYAAANKVLGALSQQMERMQPRRYLALAWTAWAETGMAVRGGMLDRLVQAGVTPLSTSAGTAACTRALTSEAHGELIVCGGLGRLDPWQSFREARFAPETCLIGEITELQPGQRLIARRRLDRSRDVFLEDHRINGYPYLPGCMGLEGFAEVAQQLHPGLTCIGFEDVTFQLPVKLTGSTLDLEFVAETVDSDGVIRVLCRLERQLQRVDGAPIGPRLVHFEGTCLLQPSRQALGKEQPIPAGEAKIPASEIYRRYFHGPSFQSHGGALGLSADGLDGMVKRELPPLLTDLSPRFAIAPLVLEAAIQNAGLLAMLQDGVRALPIGIRRVHLGPLPPEEIPLCTRASVRTTENESLSFDCKVMDHEGYIVMVLEGLRFKDSEPLPEELQLSL